MNRGIGLGDLAFGVRCVLYIPKLNYLRHEASISCTLSAHISDYKLAGTETQWEKAADFILQYLKTLRTKQGRRRAVYGAVAIGTCVRFYSLEYDADTLKTLGIEAKALDVRTDGQEINRILTYVAAGCRNKSSGCGGTGQHKSINIETASSICRRFGGRIMASALMSCYWSKRVENEKERQKLCLCEGFEPEVDNVEECSNCGHNKRYHSGV